MIKKQLIFEKLLSSVLLAFSLISCNATLERQSIFIDSLSTVHPITKAVANAYKQTVENPV